MSIPNDSDIPSKTFTSTVLAFGLEHVWKSLVLKSKDKGLGGQLLWIVRKAQDGRPNDIGEVVEREKYVDLSFLEVDNFAS